MQTSRSLSQPFPSRSFHNNNNNSPLNPTPKQTHISSYNFHRNNKSLKILNIHLKQYKTLSAIEKGQKNQKAMGMSLENGLGSGLAKSRELAAGGNYESGIKDRDKEFGTKCEVLIDNLLLNLGIFKKVYASCKKKRSVISHLYGWDPIFNPVFFVKLDGNVYSEQFRPSITKESIIGDLNLDRRSFGSQNIYNKLRLFLAELVTATMNHQEQQSREQKNKLIQSSIKLRNDLQRLSKQSGKKSTEKQRYVEMIRQTHYDMANMKMRIKNKAEEIQKLARNTGSVRMNPFYLKEEQNVHDVESFIKNVIRKS